MGADTVVNYGKFAWDIIKDGKPSVDIQNSKANAVPQVTDWQSLENTRGPASIWMEWSKPVSWPWENYVFVEFRILLKWDFGSTYNSGGAFIPNVWIEVPRCYAGWSWDVNIGMECQGPTNYGTKAAPNARMPVTIKGNVSTYEHNYTINWGYTIYGTGHWENSGS